MKGLYRIVILKIMNQVYQNYLGDFLKIQLPGPRAELLNVSCIWETVFISSQMILKSTIRNLHLDKTVVKFLLFKCLKTTPPFFLVIICIYLCTRNQSYNYILSVNLCYPCAKSTRVHLALEI